MSNRMLSNHELIARFRNRCEEKGLEDRLTKITKTLYSNKDLIKGEIQSWRQFVQKTSRNSGWSPRSLRPEFGEDILLPNSRSRSQLAGSSNAESPAFQRPWAYTYTDASHNKLYRELHQAGTNSQKTLALRTQTPGDDQTTEHPRLADEVFQATGVNKARSTWGRIPKAIADKTFDNCEARSTSNKSLARQVSKLQMVNKTKATWLPKRVAGQSLSQDNGSGQEDHSDATKMPSGKRRLVKKVSSIIEIQKSLDVFCSVCKTNRDQSDTESKLTNIAFSYKGLQRAKTVLTARRGLVKEQEEDEEDDEEEETEREKDTQRKPRCSCQCRKLRRPLSEIGTKSEEGPKLGSPPRRRVVSTGSAPTDKTSIKESMIPRSSSPGRAKVGKGVKGSERSSNVRSRAKSTTGNKKKEPVSSTAESQNSDTEKNTNGDPNTKSETNKENSTIEELRKLLQMHGVVETETKESENESKHVTGEETNGEEMNKDKYTNNDDTLKKDIKGIQTPLKPGDRGSSVKTSDDKMVFRTNDNGRYRNVKVNHEEGDFHMKTGKQAEVYLNTARPVKRPLSPCMATLTEGDENGIGLTRKGELDGLENMDLNTDDTMTLSKSNLPVEPPSTSEGERLNHSDNDIKANFPLENPSSAAKYNTDGVKNIHEEASQASGQKPCKTVQRQSSINSNPPGQGERKASDRKYSLNRKLINVHRASSVIKFTNSFLRFEMGRKHSVKPDHRVMNCDDVFTRIAKVLLHKVKLLRRFRALQSSRTENVDTTNNSGTSLSRQGSVASIDDFTLQNGSSCFHSRNSFDHGTPKPYTDLHAIAEQGESQMASGDSQNFSPKRTRFHNRNWEKAVSKANIIDTMCASKGNNTSNDNRNNNNTSNDKSANIVHQNSNKNELSEIKADSNVVSAISTENNRPKGEDKRASTTKDNKNENKDNSNNNDNNTGGVNPDNRTPGNVEKPSRGLPRRHNKDDRTRAHASATYHRGIRLSNYVSPQHRYKTAATAKSSKRGLSIRWHSAVGVTVNAYQPGASQALDSVFSKDARHRALTKMVEDNHAKGDEEDLEVISHSLRVRIKQFMRSVEPFCQEKNKLPKPWET